MISRTAARALDAAVEDRELVAQERVLGHQRGLAARQIGERADQGRDNRASGGQQSAAQALHSSAADHDQAV